MLKYEKVEKSFKVFFDGDNLSKVLDRKVELNYLTQVLQTKVSSEEMQQLLQSQTVLDKKL